MEEVKQDVDTGEFLALTISEDEWQVRARGLLRQVEHLKWVIVDQAKRAHETYHKRRVKGEWTECTLMICLHAREILKTSDNGCGEE